MSTKISDFFGQGHYLAFVDLIGQTVDGKNIYRFDFTQAPDVVWGESWNVTPAGITPKLFPDQNCLSITAQLICEHRYQLAKESTCFSMQDCIDGIIPLMFDEPYSDELVVLDFGITLEEVVERLDEQKLTLVNPKNVNEDRDNEVIDNLIDNLETQISQPPEDGEDGFDDEDDF